ncbi:hypothetical protein [Clostridioides difficile]|uniref:hypothetical protein n=1 Tax=Clostridioides difficile TaxID=1496 RepID=UPI001EDBF0A4|nr:hypothetical protein [Clostridioides difficile]
MYHQGSYDSLYKTYQNMKNQLEEQGYHIVGNIYEEDLIDYLSEHNAENYIQKFLCRLFENIKSVYISNHMRNTRLFNISYCL